MFAVRLLLARLVIRICGLPGASAHSLVNSNMLHSLLTTIQRIAIETATASPKKGRGAAARKQRAQVASSQADNSEEEDDDNTDSGPDDEDLFACSQQSTQSTSGRSQRTRSQNPYSNSNANTNAPVTGRSVSNLMQELNVNVTLFLSR
jgi:hypothetical protein